MNNTISVDFKPNQKAFYQNNECEIVSIVDSNSVVIELVTGADSEWEPAPVEGHSGYEVSFPVHSRLIVPKSHLTPKRIEPASKLEEANNILEKAKREARQIISEATKESRTIKSSIQQKQRDLDKFYKENKNMLDFMFFNQNRYKYYVYKSEQDINRNQKIYGIQAIDEQLHCEIKTKNVFRKGKKSIGHYDTIDDFEIRLKTSQSSSEGYPIMCFENLEDAKKYYTNQFKNYINKIKSSNYPPDPKELTKLAISNNIHTDVENSINELIEAIKSKKLKELEFKKQQLSKELANLEG